MAYDKVVDSSVLDDGLQQIADAIREKGGTSASLAFPDAMAEAIAAIPTGEEVEQATPSITVNSSGLITASATQTAGLVPAGTTSATKQLTTQAAKTVTPTTSNQTAVSSGRYTTGAVTVAGDSDLVAGNIKSGVSIFGVTGTYEGSGGIDTSDATATAADMAEGVTAYVNGQKVTGNIPIGAFEYENAFSAFSNSMLNLYAYSSERQILEYGDKISLFCNASVLGDATAADVAKGKTFTSASGLKLTGTHECSSGGSLPDGVTAVATGTFTPATDTVGEFISHGLGVKPTFVYYQAEGSPDISELGGYAVGGIISTMPFTDDGHTACGLAVLMSGKIYSSGDVGLDTRYTYYSDEEIAELFLISDTGFVPGLEGSTNLPVKAGVTYKWVAVAVE